MVSHYFSPHRGIVNWDQNKFLDFINSDEIKPFEYYIKNDNNGNIDLKKAVSNMSFIIRFENIQSDFNKACAKIEIIDSLLPHRNKSSREQYLKYYDSRTADAVLNKFYNEIQYFEYSIQ